MSTFEQVTEPASTSMSRKKRGIPQGIGKAPRRLPDVRLPLHGFRTATDRTSAG
jgi:hypothetical protein